MPLLDHFNPPLSRTHPWRGFHSAWAAAMARLLNERVLPTGYYAVPLVDFGGPAEIDVAALHDRLPLLPGDNPTTLDSWNAPAPALSVTVEMPVGDLIEVQVFSDAGDPHLTAAVELVSPRNKDRPRARRAFAIKCASYLNQGCSLVIVDTVTTRRADIHAELLELLEADVTTAALPPLPSAVSYRAVNRNEQLLLEAWPARLALSQPLPTLPLWIAADFSVPLDLEASYQATCADLRILQAG